MKGREEGMKKKQQSIQPATTPRATWEKPSLQRVGDVGGVFLGGGGKLSINADDSGDVRKPKGSG